MSAEGRGDEDACDSASSNSIAPQRRRDAEPRSACLNERTSSDWQVHASFHSDCRRRRQRRRRPRPAVVVGATAVIAAAVRAVDGLHRRAAHGVALPLHGERQAPRAVEGAAAGAAGAAASFMAKIRPAYRRHAVFNSWGGSGGDAPPPPALQPLPTIPPEAVEGNGFNDEGWGQFTSRCGSDCGAASTAAADSGTCCHIADRSNVGTVCTSGWISSVPTCSSSTNAASVTMLGIPATALEGAMAKARAKASREQPDLGSEYS